MEERTLHFEQLTPIDNMDLDVYEEAIDYAFDTLFQVHTVQVKAAF